MRWISLVAIALCLFSNVFAQEKKIDSSAPDINKTFIKGLAEKQLILKQTSLEGEKRNLETIRENFKIAYGVLTDWKKIAEKHWTTSTKEEKAKLLAYIVETDVLVSVISQDRMSREVLPVARAAFYGEKITEPTELQRKILASSSKEKDEAKRIALTVRECLRDTFEIILWYDRTISNVNNELRLIKKTNELRLIKEALKELSPNKQNK